MKTITGQIKNIDKQQVTLTYPTISVISAEFIDIVVAYYYA
jgi:hypothetical protein